MKHKKVSEIKHGERIMEVLPNTYERICHMLGLDKHSVQKALADLVKHQHAEKTATGYRISHGKETASGL